jgi:outer membrane receptor protein involved in Fe transport
MLFPLGLRAQQVAAVSGTLLDQSNNQPLQFANVVLLKAQDSSFVAGAQTSENGAFAVEKVAAGSYLLRASVVGYQPIKKAITLTAAAPSLHLGTLKVAPTAVQLKGVVVQGEKAAVVDNLDKKVINVSKDLNSTGGTAVDVLQNVPSVSVDQSGQVSLRGTPNVTIYVDGKPAPSTFRLDQLPASRIENVEVITNPSARYSAAGSGGVINITLKKQQKDGWNGQAVANVGTQDKYNTSLNVNRKAGKLNYFGSYDGSDNRWRGKSDLHQVATVANSTISTDQNGRNVSHGSYHGGRVGVDYDLNDNQKLTVAADLSRNKSWSQENLNTLLTRNSNAPIALQNLGYSDEHQRELDASADYRRTWAGQKGRELTANVTYVDVAVDVTVGQRVLNGPADYPRQERQQVYGVGIHVLNGQVDYVHPLGEKSHLDLGLKTENLGTDGGVDYLLQNADGAGFTRQDAFSYDYQYQQHVQAGYATYQKEIGKWSYQGGLRAEYTSIAGDVVPSIKPFDQHYLNLFPSATVVRTLTGDQRMQLSYSRRLNRPNFMQFLALPIYSDQRNYRIGNPSIRPEYVNAFELGHQTSMGQTSLSTTLFFRQTNQSIQSIREIDTVATRLSGQPDFISRTSYRNFGSTNNYGVELSISQPVAKWWKISANGSFFRNELTSFSGDGRNRSNYTGTARLMNTFNPTKQLDVQLTSNYRGAVITAQGRMASVYSTDIALRQRLFNDKAALTLRLSDIFNTKRQYTELYSEGLTADFQTKRETRVGYLGFTYYFGNSKPSKKIEQNQKGGGGGFGG